MFFNLTVVIAHKRDWAVFALVLPFPPGIFWIPFWKENELPRAQFFFPKRKHEFSFATAGEEGGRARVPKAFRGLMI